LSAHYLDRVIIDVSMEEEVLYQKKCSYTPDLTFCVIKKLKINEIFAKILLFLILYLMGSSLYLIIAKTVFGSDE
jgi:hypothetical protein